MSDLLKLILPNYKLDSKLFFCTVKPFYVLLIPFKPFKNTLKTRKAPRIPSHKIY